MDNDSFVTNGCLKAPDSFTLLGCLVSFDSFLYFGCLSPPNSFVALVVSVLLTRLSVLVVSD